MVIEHKSFTQPPQSYWLASTPQTEYPSLTEDTKVDVAIIGGGITGISCAYLLNKEGIKTAVIEADRILQGATGHTTAKVTSQHGLIYGKLNKMSEEFARQYADANESAIRMIAKIIADKQIECDFQTESAYLYSLENKYIDRISEEAKVASALGIKASYLEEIPLPFSIIAGVRFDNQAQFHPRKFLLPLAADFSNNSGKIFEQTRALDLEEAAQTYEIITNQGKKIAAEKVIFASHYPFYNKAGLYFTRIYQERSYVLAIKAKESYPGGMYIAAEESGHSFRNQISADGELILVGGKQHKTGQGEDTAKNYEALAEFASQVFSLEDIPYRWSTQDCLTLDALPYVGHFTVKTPNLFIATGFGKWGMTNSMASAMLLKDLIINGKSPWQDVYNPSRQTLLASAKNFVVENLNVTDKLIEGKLSRAPEQVELKPGQGGIFAQDGERLGGYRDEQGDLHLVDTTCTHLGCELNWNSAEKSWDCPCHGSRFSCAGNIIEGPAVKPLGLPHDVNTIEKALSEPF